MYLLIAKYTCVVLLWTVYCKRQLSAAAANESKVVSAVATFKVFGYRRSHDKCTVANMRGGVNASNKRACECNRSDTAGQSAAINRTERSILQLSTQHWRLQNNKATTKSQGRADAQAVLTHSSIAHLAGPF